MDLVKWLALCAIREKKGEREEEREGEQKKKRNAIAIIIPFDQETSAKSYNPAISERRIVTDLDRGPKIPQMLENRVERR